MLSAFCFASGQTNVVNGLTWIYSSMVDSNQYVRLTWPASNGVSYQVQVCTDIGLTNWAVYTNVLSATNGGLSQECYLAGTNATFRVMR